MFRRRGLAVAIGAHGIHRQGERGFSLLEVVVALALLGLVLALLGDSLRSGVIGNNKAVAAQRALALAEQRLAELGTVQNLEPGSRSGSAGPLRWKTSTERYSDEGGDFEPAAAPSIYRLRVVVSWGDRRRPHELALETLRLGTSP